MSARKRKQIDPLDQAIEAALSPGSFRPYRAAWPFVDDVQDVANRAYRALCMRIVNASKSKYYDAALDNIEHAKKCYAKAGLDADWEAVLADVRERHFRKRGFMAGFEEIVSDAPKLIEPPFLKRAKARWPRRPEGK